MTRRLGAGGGRSLDWRVLLIGAILVLGTVILLLVLLFGRGGSPNGGIVGTVQLDDGRGHIPACQPGSYSSVPPTSGCHSDTPAEWGVYSFPQDEVQLIHNLEHGGILIWYQPGQLDADGVNALTSYVQSQVGTERFKVILAPWSGADFGHPIAVTAWRWLLYLDTADVDSVRSFLDAHYGDAPESGGGPGPPTG